MKNINFFSLFIIIIIFTACNKDTAIVNSNNHTENQMSLSEGIANLSYLEDFIIPPNNDNRPRNTAPSMNEAQLLHTASKRNISELAASFENSKDAILELYHTDSENNVRVIQSVALRYLRRYLLVTPETLASRTETLSLLNILVSTKSNDLDVLVDAYLFSEPLMTNKQEVEIRTYLSNLYKKEMEVISSTYEQLENGYSSSEGETKNRYLLLGKALERRSQACNHAKTLLGNINH